MAQDITEYLIKYKTSLEELNRAKTATDDLTKKILKSDVNYQKLDKTQKKTYDSIVANNKKATDMTDNLNSAIKNAVVGFVGFAAIKQATKLYADFDDQLKRTQALTGATAMETMKLQKQAKELGATTAFSASQVAEAQGNMAQTGLKVNEILAATPGILSLASAGQLDMGTATNLTTSALNIFGLSADKATRVADVLAQAQANSAGNTQWFGSAIANVGANAKSLGYSLEQTTGILASMAHAFNDGGSAGTSLNAILRDMTKHMDKQGQVMIGKNRVTVAENGTMLEMSKIIANVTKATQGMTDVQKRQALATIFGDESMRGFNVLLGQGANKITDMTNKMTNSDGIAKKMADTMESGLGGSLRTLLSATEDAALTMTEALMPAIQLVVDTTTGLMSVVSQVAGLYRDYPKTMTAVTVALTGYIAIQKAIVLWNTLINTTNPFGWIKLAITGVILALGYLEKKFSIVSKTITAVKGFFGIKTDDKATDTVQTEIPAHAKGTNNAPGGISLVGENGPELVNLKKGSQVIPTEKTQKLLGGNKNIVVEGDKVEINISGNNLDINDILEEVREEYDRRERRKQARILSALA